MRTTQPSKKSIVSWRYMLTEGVKHANDPLYLIGKTFEHLKVETYHLRAPGLKRMMTRDPKVINHILQQNNKNYYKSKLQTKNLAKYAGKGLLTTNGDYWLKQRRLIQPGFHKRKIESLISQMNETIIEFVAKLKVRVAKDSKVDMLTEMTALTLKVVSNALFSSNISDEQISLLGEGVTELQAATYKEVQRPELNLWRKLNGAERKSFERVGKIVNLVLGLIEERKTEKNPPEDLLTMLLDSRYEDTGEGMTNEQIVDEIMIIFLAGFETTTNSLAFTFYLLSKNRDKFAILMNEIDSKEISLSPSMEEVMNLDYTRQVTAESLRLYPPAWFIDRVALDNDKVGDVIIDKDEIIALYIYGLHRLEKYWIEPDSFLPERFSQDKLASIPKNIYLPFGRGPRFCIGSQFAQIEMQLALFHLLSEFEFSLDEDYKLELDAKITIRPKSGLPLTLQIRY